MSVPTAVADRVKRLSPSTPVFWTRLRHDGRGFRPMESWTWIYKTPERQLHPRDMLEIRLANGQKVRVRPRHQARWPD